VTCLRDNGGIPLVSFRKSHLIHLQTMKRTLSGGQFNWGGCLLKRTASVQRYSYSGWKSEWTRNGRRVLDCEAYKPSRDESRS
jgi:hypothetical protein